MCGADNTPPAGGSRWSGALERHQWGRTVLLAAAERVGVRRAATPIGVSRTTGYRWRRRRGALADRSGRPDTASRAPGESGPPAVFPYVFPYAFLYGNSESPQMLSETADSWADICTCAPVRISATASRSWSAPVDAAWPAACPAPGVRRTGPRHGTPRPPAGSIAAPGCARVPARTRRLFHERPGAPRSRSGRLRILPTDCISHAVTAAQPTGSVLGL